MVASDVSPAAAAVVVRNCSTMLSEYPLLVSDPDRFPPIDTLAEPGSEVAIDEVAIDEVTEAGVR